MDIPSTPETLTGRIGSVEVDRRSLRAYPKTQLSCGARRSAPVRGPRCGPKSESASDPRRRRSLPVRSPYAAVSRNGSPEIGLLALSNPATNPVQYDPKTEMELHFGIHATGLLRK